MRVSAIRVPRRGCEEAIAALVPRSISRYFNDFQRLAAASDFESKELRQS